MEFKINALGNNFRVAKMNAIEALAMRNVIDFDNFETTTSMIKIILEHIEVQCDDKWLPVKEKGREVYFPNDIENDLFALTEIMHKFLDEYYKPLFRKSDVSKN